MKKIVLFGFVLFLVSFTVAAAPFDSLQQYYEADKNEDIDTLLSLTDLSEADAEFKEETRKNMEALAEIFDTNFYELSDEKVFVDEEDAIIYYHLKTELEDTSGESAVIDMDYVAVMHQFESVWKVVYVQPKDSFEQNMMLRETTIALGESYQAEVDFSALQEIEDEQSNEKSTSDEDVGSDLAWGFAIIFIFLAIFVFWFWMLIDSITRKINNKWLWILMILILGIFGALIYFFVERKRAKKK